MRGGDRIKNVVMQDLDGSVSKVSFSFMHIMTYVKRSKERSQNFESAQNQMAVRVVLLCFAF